MEKVLLSVTRRCLRADLILLYFNAFSVAVSVLAPTSWSTFSVELLKRRQGKRRLTRAYAGDVGLSVEDDLNPMKILPDVHTKFDITSPASERTPM